MLTDEQRADGWIEHNGGSCPVDDAAVVRFITNDGGETTIPLRADKLDWSWEGWSSDIIAYRLETPND